MRRTALMFALAGMVGAMVATPIAVYATHVFTDVSDSAFYSNSVTWMKDNGITVGCNPPANTKYCPNDNLTRGEMAVLMKRLSENKIVDAATAVNADNATNADNAETLDGFSANQLLRVASGSTDNAPDDNGFMVSATITAPQAGWLILSGSVDGFGVINDNYRCHLVVDLVQVAGTRRTSVVHSVGAPTHTNNSEGNCSTTGVQQVTAGTHKVALTIRDRDTVDFRNAHIWALFVPFDGNGNKP